MDTGPRFGRTLLAPRMLAAWVLAGACYGCDGCNGDGASDEVARPRVAHERPRKPPRKPRKVSFTQDEALKGLRMVLRDARSAEQDAGNGPPTTRGTPLSEQEADRLLARADSLKVDPGDTQAFNKRASSKPPP
ncbi:MAG: hypothetical protein OXR73_17120, partial [Myxococcales bacterium]|nr:hypothetical protein [Myxococcales bacterium]